LDCISSRSSRLSYTLEEAQANIREAIQLWIETARSCGWPVPAASTQIERIVV